MSDISTSDQFASGTTITATRLNNQISNAVINAGAITSSKIAAGAVGAEQLASSLDLSAKSLTLPATMISALSAITTTEDADYFQIWDATDSSLKKVSRATLVNAFSPPGAVIQTVYAEYTDWSTGGLTSTAMPWRDVVAPATVPLPPQLSTDGGTVVTASITPSSANNKILVRASGMIATDASYCGGALFRNTMENAIYAAASYCTTASYPSLMDLEVLDSPSSTSPTLYTVKIGGASAVACYVNGISTKRLFGEATRWKLVLQEIKG